MYVINLFNKSNELNIQIREIEREAKVKLQNDTIWHTVGNNGIVSFKNLDKLTCYNIEVDYNNEIKTFIFQTNSRDVKPPKNIKHIGGAAIKKDKISIPSKITKYEIGGDI